MSSFLRQARPINPAIVRSGPTAGKRVTSKSDYTPWPQCEKCCSPTPQEELRLALFRDRNAILRACRKCREGI